MGIFEWFFPSDDKIYEMGYDHGSKGLNKTQYYIENEEYLRGYQNGHYEANKHDYALTCRKCNKDAFPVKGTARHYNCTCGNKFTGARHPF